MKRRFVTVLIVLMLFAVVLPTTALTVANAASIGMEPVSPAEITPDYSWYSVDKTEYTITTVEQLAGFAKLTQGKVDGITDAATNFLGKTVKLGADITFADNQYWYYYDGTTTYDYKIRTFAGTFDGQNKTITGLKFYHSTTSDPSIYLFEAISTEGSVMNLTLDTVSANINDRDRFGFIALTLSGTATNCHVKNVDVMVNIEPNGQTGYAYSSGAMFGSVSAATITNCSAQKVTFTCTGTDNMDNVGALIGTASGTEAKHTVISNCFVEDVIYNCTRKTKRTGGFIGNASNTDITDCTIKKLNIKVDTYYQSVGGFVGSAGGNANFTNCKVEDFIMGCGDTATIAGDVGGFAGLCYSNVKFTGCAVQELDMDLISDNNGWGNGGFIGWQSGSNIIVEECVVSGEITIVGNGTEVSAGGFIGVSNNSSIEIKDSASDMALSSNGTAGGLIGTSNGGTISDCEVKGSVTSTDGVAGGMVGYLNSSATLNLKGSNTPATDISGVITNKIANSPDGHYEFEDNGSVDFVPDSDMCCYGSVAGVNIGFKTIQEAVDAGAGAVTLLANSTESFTLMRDVSDDFTLDLGAFTYNGVITVLREIGSFAVKGTSEGNSIVLTEPFKDHHLFNGWCNGTNNTQNIAPEAPNGWSVSVGQTYHTHFTESTYEHLTFEELHPDFGEVYYGATTEAKCVTFVKRDATEADAITGFVAEADCFDLSSEGLTLTIMPKANLDIGTYEEIIHVVVADGSTHGVTAKVTVKKSQAVIDVDTSDIVVIHGKEWQLPAASTNLGAVQTDKTVTDMAEEGVYTVTYSVAGTDNYNGDSKQIKVTVILNPTTVQDNLEEAVKNLEAAISNKAAAASLEKAISDLEKAYKEADTLINGKLPEFVKEDAAIKESLAAIEKDLKKAEDTSKDAVKAVQDSLDKTAEELSGAIAQNKTDLSAELKALDSAYKAADTLLGGELAKLAAEDTAIREDITALEKALSGSKTELEAAIQKVTENLEAAKNELNAAIAAGDAALNEKIAGLDSAYKAADLLLSGELAKLAAEDKTVKESITALEKSFAEVKKELESAIDALQKELDGTKSELEAAIAELKKTLEGTKAELSEKDQALQQQLAQQEKALKSQVMALVIALAAVGAISVVSLAVTVIVLKKRSRVFAG